MDWNVVLLTVIVVVALGLGMASGGSGGGGGRSDHSGSAWQRHGGQHRSSVCELADPSEVLGSVVTRVSECCAARVAEPRAIKVLRSAREPIGPIGIERYVPPPEATSASTRRVVSSTIASETVGARSSIDGTSVVVAGPVDPPVAPRPALRTKSG